MTEGDRVATEIWSVDIFLIGTEVERDMQAANELVYLCNGYDLSVAGPQLMKVLHDYMMSVETENLIGLATSLRQFAHRYKWDVRMSLDFCND